MPRGLYFHIEAVGAENVQDDWDAVARRMQNARPAFEEAASILEEGEKRHFARQRGKYVDSGALLASLTQPSANDAIRDAHADELVFGTSVYYAKFLRKGKKSAVLVMQAKTRKTATQTILDYITYGAAEVAL